MVSTRIAADGDRILLRNWKDLAIMGRRQRTLRVH
jgi:hypothetical protein